eukprot:194742-Chlamydomonas_euryale.AAC.1
MIWRGRQMLQAYSGLLVPFLEAARHFKPPCGNRERAFAPCTARRSAVCRNPFTHCSHICMCAVARQVRLAKGAVDDAAEALRLDPTYDLAHHLMGR